jgi:DNA-binding protein HU-beta
MNKKELSNQLAEKLSFTNQHGEDVVNAVLDLITSALASGEKVALSGFGTFEVKERVARTGRNPSTGDPMDIAEHRAPTFKSGKNLKDAVQ